MNQRQWRVLYRQFLFRVFDLEVLSGQADGANRLLGQFAALLVFFSVMLSFGALLMDPGGPATENTIRLILTMIAQHFLIATTMLVVGIFAVLSWDATFPDKRDVFVLAPLPVRTRTMFLAKVGAVGSSLGLTVLLLHCAMGLAFPLVLTRLSAPATLPVMTFDPTGAPVRSRDLKAVMDRDLKQALTTGDLAPGSPIGMAIGVLSHGERRVLTYGAAKEDSEFEIGSISKTFTGLMLARMVADGKARLDEPVRELLPAGTVSKPGGQEITLLDLATHHSGLPPIPDNYDRFNPHPFAVYEAEQLYGYLAQHGLAKPEDAGFVYSNLGVGLLGHALSVRAGKSYEDLLHDEVTAPLGLADTSIGLSADAQRRLLQGYDEKHHPADHVSIAVLAGAGGLHSTAGDMITYLGAHLHPEKYARLSGALALSHPIRENAGADTQIALTWQYVPVSRIYTHNGGTQGFTASAFFEPHADCAAVVLLNMNGGITTKLSADGVAEHIRQRLTGEPAISLDTVFIPVNKGFTGLLRQFGAYWFTMIAAGIFMFGAVLGVQGMAQLLPRRLFLRVSGYLQLAIFVTIVGVYFFQPGFGGLNDLTFGSVFRMIQWLPSYWFLALYQQLNGTMHPALEPLAHRAWTGLVCVVCGTAIVYSLSYWRTLRRIPEDPDIGPGRVRSGWLPRFGTRPQTAIGQFSVRALMRSRQHRLILAFYLGIGLALTALMLKGSPDSLSNPYHETSAVLWASSVLMMVLALVGTRVAFALPLDVRANWIFRLTGVAGGVSSLAACRRALILLAAAPIWILTAIVALWLRPDRQSAGHLVVLGFTGLIVIDICLLGFRKIPFTCSWLPGKKRMNMAFLGALGLLLILGPATELERNALRRTGSTMLMLALIAAAWVCLRWASVRLAKGEEAELRFEEEETPAVQQLGLFRDGVLPIAPPSA